MILQKFDENGPITTNEDIFESNDLLADAFRLAGCDDDIEMPDESSAQVESHVNEGSELVPTCVYDCAYEDTLTSLPATSEADVAFPKHKSSQKASSKGEAVSRGKATNKSRVKIEKSKHRVKKGKIPSPKAATITPKPHETKQDAIRRVKNNLASRDFRSRKKYRLEDLLTSEQELIVQNKQLKGDIASIEEVVNVLKEGLIENARNRHH